MFHHLKIVKGKFPGLETLSVVAGIDEMPKSEIEKRKRNMESISQIFRREMRNVEICFLVQIPTDKIPNFYLFLTVVFDDNIIKGDMMGFCTGLNHHLFK